MEYTTVEFSARTCEFCNQYHSEFVELRDVLSDDTFCCCRNQECIEKMAVTVLEWAKEDQSE